MTERISPIIISSIITILCVSCGLTATPSPDKKDTQTATIPEVMAILSTLTTTPTGLNIQPYDDVRFKNLILDNSIIQTLWFNEKTIWPGQKTLETARDILEKGKNPGLGVRNLHAQGITGKGINVAIIDQNLQLDHPEFKGKIVKYYDVGTNSPTEEGSMHAPAVTSLLVGEKIGTAPEAKVYFVAAPSWTADAQFYADALNWIIDENATLPRDKKIRVVSVSAAPSGEGSPFIKNNSDWDEAYQRAVEAGILVLDCTSNRGLTAPCTLDLENPDDVAKCIPGYPNHKSMLFPDRIYIPTSHRTTAEEYTTDNPSYQYTGVGGLSWSIPYLAGVLAMGWQVNPELTNSQIMGSVFESAYITKENIKIINPEAFIDLIKDNMNK